MNDGVGQYFSQKKPMEQTLRRPLAKTRPQAREKTGGVAEKFLSIKTIWTTLFFCGSGGSGISGSLAKWLQNKNQGKKSKNRHGQQNVSKNLKRFRR